MYKTDRNIMAVFIAVMISIVSVSTYAYTSQANIVGAVKRGVLKLECDMKDGTRIIEPSLIKDYINDTWVFVNGSAKSCRVLP